MTVPWIFVSVALAADPAYVPPPVVILVAEPTPLPLSDKDRLEVRRPTCFPIEAAVYNEVFLGQITAPVFLEEETSCVDGAPTPMSTVVPSVMVGDLVRLQYILDQADGTVDYEIEARGGGWLIASGSKPRLSDVRVSVDAATAPTLVDAERQIFNQVAMQAFVAFGANGFDDSTVPNHVSLNDVPMLEAFQALWAPHQTNPVSGLFRVYLEAAPNGMRRGTYQKVFEFNHTGPEMPINAELLHK